jgi:CelD/BcsL family acetyltransferase involved in cellulose biosynthesis
VIERIPISSASWLRFVTSSDVSTPFHHPAWALALAGCYSLDAFALVLRADSGDLIAGMPVIQLPRQLRRCRRWSSLPFTDECNVLCSEANGMRFHRELQAYLEATAVDELDVGGAMPGVQGVRSPDHVVHVLELPASIEDAEKRFRPAVRRNIRAARSAGLTVRRTAGDDEALDAFYRLHLSTRRRQGLPTQPRRFFASVFHDMIDQGLGHVTLVERRGQPIAAAIFLRWNGSDIFKWGASDRSAWSLRPNNLLFADEIAAACERGDRTLHFGKSDVVDVGLRRFKAGWGAVESPLVSVHFGAPQAGRNPPPILRHIIRRSPSFVSRSLGEMLYRYAA